MTLKRFAQSNIYIHRFTNSNCYIYKKHFLLLSPPQFLILQEAEECARKQEQERTKQLLQRILPQVSVDGKEVFSSQEYVGI